MNPKDQDQSAVDAMNTISVSEGADGAGSVLARHPGGRPVKWTPEAIEAEGEALLAWLMEDESRFWVKSFATERGYSPQRFSEWVKVSPEFSEAYEIARGIQESRLLHMGLRGRGQSMAILVVSRVLRTILWDGSRSCLGWLSPMAIAPHGGLQVIGLHG